MSSHWDWIVALVLLALAAVQLVLGARGLRTTRMVLARRTTPIGSITEGPVEIEGIVHAAGQTHTGADGIECVAVHYKVEELEGTGKGARWVVREDYLLEAAAELRDATGSCLLDLESLELLGDVWHKPPQHTYKRHTHTLVPVGARVLVLGDAVASGVVSGDGYRDAKPRYTVRGSPGRSVLVSTSGHTRTLWRTAWPALVTLLGGTICLAAALTLVAVNRALTGFHQ